MQLPERFKQGPMTAQLAKYIAKRYSKYGYPRDKVIAYNREFQVEHSSDRYRWVENVTDGLRKAGDAGDLIRLDHTGWYTDNFQDETVHGEVYQLPARNGECLYVPAVNDSCNPDCACVDFRSVTDDKEDAARWADSMAESWAEREREYQAQEDAKQRISDIDDEIKAEFQDFRRIAKELRESCDRISGVAVVRELVKARWAQTKAAIHKLRDERERIEREGMCYY